MGFPLEKRKTLPAVVVLKAGGRILNIQELQIKLETLALYRQLLTG